MALVASQMQYSGSSQLVLQGKCLLEEQVELQGDSAVLLSSSIGKFVTVTCI